MQYDQLRASQARRQAANIACVLIFALSAAQPAKTQDSDPDQPFAIVTSPLVDENLFMLRLLADVYSSWPNIQENRSQLPKWFSDARHTISAVRGQIHARRLDPDLELVYDDCLSYMAATEDYLKAVEVIDNQNNTQTVFDVISSLWSGYKDGSGTQSKAQELGMSSENAADAGKVVGTVSALSDYYTKSQQRSAAYNAALQTESKKLEDLWTTTWASAQTVAQRFTSKYNWSDGEAGFDSVRSPTLTDNVKRHPRDAFIKARYADSLAKDGNVTQFLQAAYTYLEAAQWVPADASYDALRLQYIAEASDLGLDASSVEAGELGYSSHPSSAPYSLRLARTYLAMDPQDKTGRGHVQLARALAFTGRYDDAATNATAAYRSNKDWGADVNFCYRYALLMSLTNDLDLVGNWIVQAYRNGFSAIAPLRRSPDLANYRNGRPQQFVNLTTVRWTWQIRYGWMLDDVIIKNDSAFNLTNVRVQLHIRKGNESWNPEIKCALIKPGETCENDNVMSVTGNSYDEGNASLTSDQN